MKGEGYPYVSNNAKTEYYFDSVGEKGVISKKVEYTQMSPDTWNLAFGDETKEDFDDKVISNNQDIRKVIQTVVNTIYDFTEKYPDRRVYIEPVDGKRKTFYNAVLRRKWQEVEMNFKVSGVVDGVKVDYHPSHEFDAFVVRRKSVLLKN